MYTNVPLTSIIKIASAWYLLRGEKSNRKTSAFLLHKLDVLTRGWSCCIFNYLVFILYIFISFHFDQFDPAKQREVWCCRRYDAECELQSVSFFDHFLGRHAKTSHNSWRSQEPLSSWLGSLVLRLQEKRRVQYIPKICLSISKRSQPTVPHPIFSSSGSSPGSL